MYRHCVLIKEIIQHTSTSFYILHKIFCDGNKKIIYIFVFLSKIKVTLYIDFFSIFNKKCILSRKSIVFIYNS